MRRQSPEDIRNALKTLPKTLDETYERIFENIHEEDYPFVQAAFALICGSEETQSMYKLPAEHLLKLVGETSDSSIANDEDHPFTLSSLRDACGCLLTLSVEGNIKILELAHYTVKEYLYSDRIARGPVYRHALSDSIARCKLATRTLTVACQANKWDMEYHRGFLSHFGPFCVITSTNLLPYCEMDAIDNIELQQLYFQFLNPSRPTSYMLAWESNFSLAPIHNHSIKLNAAIFINLIFTRLLSLAREFLKTRDVEDILFNPSRRSNKDESSELSSNIYVFGDTIIDIVSSLKGAYDYKYRNRTIDYVADVVEIAIEFYHPTIALMMHLAAHRPSDIGRWDHDEQHVGHFLEKGADPNALGYRNTPLQITVWRLDYYSSFELLKAGANVNGIGDPNGMSIEFIQGIVDDIEPSITPLNLAIKMNEMGMETENILDLLQKNVAEKKERNYSASERSF
jgi:hypothetical protein